jgi:hypothetical protein
MKTPKAPETRATRCTQEEGGACESRVEKACKVLDGLVWPLAAMVPTNCWLRAPADRKVLNTRIEWSCCTTGFKIELPNAKASVCLVILEVGYAIIVYAFIAKACFWDRLSNVHILLMLTQAWVNSFERMMAMRY